MTTTHRLTARHIADLTSASFHAALVEVDGRLDIVRDITAVDLTDDAIVLRHPARQWATGLLDLARAAAEEDGTSTHLGTLRAAAARLATDELAEEAARQAVVATPPRRPALAGLPRPRGRHAAPRSAVTQEAETHALCALLDELEAADLLRAS